MGISSIMTISSRNVFSGANVKLQNGNKNNKNNKSQAISGKSDGAENSVISVKNNSLAEAITQLKEQVEKVKVNEKFDDKTKKHKIESLLTQIKELEEIERRQKMDEATKALEGDKDELSQKIKQKKQEFEKNQKETNGVEITLSEEGFKSLVTADLELKKVGEKEVLKAKKSMEFKQVEIEQKNDQDYGQAMQNAAKAADSMTYAKKISASAIEEFSDKHGTLSEFLEEVDKTDSAMLKNYIDVYTKELTAFANQRVEEELNSEEFNSGYIYTSDDKEALKQELMEIIGNIDSQIMESLKKANEAVGEVSQNGEEGNTEEAHKAIDEEVGDVINREVQGSVRRELESM